MVKEYPDISQEKEELLQRLHSFLLTGKKDATLDECDEVSPYATHLNNLIDNVGFYKEDTPQQTIDMFTYLKNVQSEKATPFAFHIKTLENELDLHLEKP